LAVNVHVLIADWVGMGTLVGIGFGLLVPGIDRPVPDENIVGDTTRGVE
jgi:hypothetical protein